MLKKMTCRVCGAEFQARHTPAYYCSNACKQKAKRQRGAKPYEPVFPAKAPDVSAPAVPAECERAVAEAHRLANDLGRLSRSAPFQLRARFGRIGEALARALEAEGL